MRLRKAIISCLTKIDTPGRKTRHLTFSCPLDIDDAKKPSAAGMYFLFNKHRYKLTDWNAEEFRLVRNDRIQITNEYVQDILLEDKK